MLDNGHKAVCDDRNVNLYSHSILSIAPEGRDSEMLLYPSEEQLNLPSLLVQQSNITGLGYNVVSQESERSLQFRSVVNYPPGVRILLLGLVARKAYRLVKQNVIRFIQQVFTVNNLVVEMRLLSDDEVGVDNVDSVQSGKVIIAFVKDVERIRLIRNVIHRIHIVDFSLRDMNVGRNLGHNIKQCVDFDTLLRFSERYPWNKLRQRSMVGRVKRIELSMQDELCPTSCSVQD